MTFDIMTEKKASPALSLLVITLCTIASYGVLYLVYLGVFAAFSQ
jgi:hypothetical protein